MIEQPTPESYEGALFENLESDHAAINVAWSVLMGALEGDGQCADRMPEVYEELEAIRDTGPSEIDQFDAATPLAFQHMYDKWIAGDSIESNDIRLAQQNVMGIIDRLTNGSYQFRDLPECLPYKAWQMYALGIFAHRYEDLNYIALPAPLAGSEKRWDEQYNCYTKHNIYVTTPKLGLVGVHAVARNDDIRHMPTPRDLVVPRLVFDVGRLDIPALRERSFLEGTINKGRRMIIEYGLRALAKEAAGTPLDVEEQQLLDLSSEKAIWFVHKIGSYRAARSKR